MADTTLIIGNARAGLFDGVTDKNSLLNRLINELCALNGGIENGTVKYIASAGAVKAYGTLTCLNVLPANTCVVGGVTFTAVADSATPTATQFKIGGNRATNTVEILGALAADDTVVVNSHAFTAKSSGATGDQFNIGASLTATAANLAAAINASITSGIAGVFTATSAVETVTIQVVAQGTAGNSYTLTQTGDGVTVGGATFSGGTLDATATAAYLAAAINANTTTSKLVAAASALGVVTCTCLTPGVIGNHIVLTSGTNITAATMANGAGSYTTLHFGA